MIRLRGILVARRRGRREFAFVHGRLRRNDGGLSKRQATRTNAPGWEKMPVAFVSRMQIREKSSLSAKHLLHLEPRFRINHQMIFFLALITSPVFQPHNLTYGSPFFWPTRTRCLLLLDCFVSATHMSTQMTQRHTYDMAESHGLSSVEHEFSHESSPKRRKLATTFVRDEDSKDTRVPGPSQVGYPLARDYDPSNFSFDSKVTRRNGPRPCDAVWLRGRGANYWKGITFNVVGNTLRSFLGTNEDPGQVNTNGPQTSMTLLATLDPEDVKGVHRILQKMQQHIWEHEMFDRYFLTNIHGRMMINEIKKMRKEGKPFPNAIEYLPFASTQRFKKLDSSAPDWNELFESERGDHPWLLREEFCRSHQLDAAEVLYEEAFKLKFRFPWYDPVRKKDKVRCRVFTVEEEEDVDDKSKWREILQNDWETILPQAYRFVAAISVPQVHFWKDKNPNAHFQVESLIAVIRNQEQTETFPDNLSQLLRRPGKTEPKLEGGRRYTNIHATQPSSSAFSRDSSWSSAPHHNMPHASDLKFGSVNPHRPPIPTTAKY